MTRERIVNFFVGQVLKAGRAMGLYFDPLAVRSEVVKQLEGMEEA